MPARNLSLEQAIDHLGAAMTRLSASDDRTLMDHIRAAQKLLQKIARHPPPGAPLAYSIKQFCKAYGISEAHYFRLREQGLAPEEIRLNTRVIISLEAAERWEKARAADPKK